MTTYTLPPHAIDTRARRIGEIVRELHTLDADKGFAVTIKQETRSDRQNRYWHGTVVRLVHDHARDHHGLEHGHDVWHEYLRDRFLPATEHHVGSRAVVMRASTASLSRAEFSDLVERVQAWAATDLGLVIPDPDPELRATHTRKAA